MRLIPAFEASPKGYADLYQTVLVDTPIGPYFSQFLEQQNERLANAGQVRRRLSKMKSLVHPRLPSAVPIQCPLEQRRKELSALISFRVPVFTAGFPFLLRAYPFLCP